jgi:23S rRNA (guanosine2251-2'-O)-methyltransferase
MAIIHVLISKSTELEYRQWIVSTELSPSSSARAQRRGLQRICVANASQGDRINEILQAAKRAGVPVERRERETLDDMARHARHQGVVGVLARQGKSTYVDPESVFEHLGPTPLVVLLDGIEDPHNLGAILRSCEGAGVDGVFLPEHRAAGLTDTVAKTSAGAVEHLRIVVTNLVPLIEESSSAACGWSESKVRQDELADLI